MDPGEGSCAVCGIDPYGALGDLELQFSVLYSGDPDCCPSALRVVSELTECFVCRGFRRGFPQFLKPGDVGSML